MVHSPWLRAVHFVQLTYICFHLSVAAMIAMKVAVRHESFCTGFYILYVIQSFFDLCSYAFTTVLRAYSYIGMAPEFLSHSTAGVAFYYTVGFCVASQECYHVANAFNR
ncbi:hypothetical protein AAVH_20603, partial [Aphelenchoides avenae]